MGDKPKEVKRPALARVTVKYVGADRTVQRFDEYLENGDTFETNDRDFASLRDRYKTAKGKPAFELVKPKGKVK